MRHEQNRTYIQIRAVRSLSSLLVGSRPQGNYGPLLKLLIVFYYYYTWHVSDVGLSIGIPRRASLVVL